MASPQLVGFALIFAFFAMLWISGHLRPGALRTDGSRIEDPWSSPNWCASEGSGSNGAEDDPERPRQRPLVIEDITRRRWKVLIWLKELGIPLRDQEDVAQEIMSGAWKSAPGYDPDRGKIDTWLYRIAFHHAAHFRRQAYTRRAVVCDPEEGPWQQIHDPDNPEELVAEVQDLEHAQEILARLPPHLATALVTVDFRGMDAKAYGRAHGKSPSTIHSWLKQARKALALEVKQEELLDRGKTKR